MENVVEKILQVKILDETDRELQDMNFLGTLFGGKDKL